MPRPIWLASITMTALVAGGAVAATSVRAEPAAGGSNAVTSHAVTSAASGLASTPPMGWNSYNAYACDNGAQNMEAVAKFIHDSGLERDGYEYVNADGCYDDLEGLGSPNTYGVTAPTPQDPETCGAINGRLPNGQIFVNSYAFPPSRPCANNGFQLVGDRLHTLGLKLGLYLDASNNWNCEEIPGSYGFDTTDASALASWGVNYVKIDWGCGDSLVPPASNAPAGYTGIDAAPGNQGFGGPTFSTNPAYAGSQEQTQIKMYTALSNAIRGTGRSIVTSFAGAGTVNSQDWAFQAGAQLDRPTGDANANFTATGKKAAGSVVGIINADAQTYDALTGPGHWIDPDAMEIGNGSLTLAQDQSEMSMFSEMAEPLLMSTNLCPGNCGPDTTPATSAQLAQDVSVFGNTRVIAVDQDKLGKPAHIVGSFDGTHLIMAKPLANGDVAVTLFNESTTDAATMSTTAAAVGLPSASSYALQDLWTGQSSTSTGQISATVPPTGTVMFRIHPGSASAATAAQGASTTSTATVTQPRSDSAPQTAAFGSQATPANLLGVTCESASQCTAVDNAGTKADFNPAGGRSAAVGIDPGKSLVSISCPGKTQCTALDSDGTELTFNPGLALPFGQVRHAVDAGNEPTAVACVSSTQCTVVDGKGNEVTFNPVTGRTTAGGVKQVDPYTYLGAVSCPSATQCTAAGGGGNNGDTEVTFNPLTGQAGAAAVTSLDSATVNGVSSVSCPSAQQCTVVDGSGNELTFDPQTGTVNAAGVAPLEGANLPAGLGVMTSVSCPSAGQCTAVDASGKEVTFNPATGTVNAAGAKLADHAGGLESVSCLATRAQCTAVDLTGHQVTFNPASGAVIGSAVVDGAAARF
ncbi:MAG TPA: glycoside hydrolase family 27 protein [Streptosporangiaceae bacterium]